MDFYPSEIARLVLGYLAEMKWTKSWQTFLEESSDLQEYFSLFKKGRVYATEVNGKSLSDILKEYCVLKKEALVKGTYQEQSSKSNIQEGINVDAVEKVIKNSLDLAFQKYLPSACISKLNEVISDNRANDPSLECRLNDPVSHGLANDSDDSVVFIRNTIKEELEENINEENRIQSADHPNIHLNIPERTDTPAFRPNITNVMSLTNRAYNSMNLSENELTTPSLLALQSVARMCLSRNFSIENCTKDSTLDASNKESQNSSSGNKSLELPTVIKIEDEDNEEPAMSHTTVQSESNDHAEMVSVQRKGCGTTDNGIIIRELHKSYTASFETEKNSSACNANTSLSSLNSEDIVKFKSNSEMVNSNSEGNPVRKDSSAPSLNFNNLNIQQVSPLNTQSSFVNTLSSENNLSGFSITSSSVPNQLSAVNDVSLSSVPMYILPNFPPGSQIVQNNTPYQFIIKNPVNGMSLTVPTVPVNSISNPVFTVTNPSKDHGAQQKKLVPIACSKGPTKTASSSSTKNSDLVVVKDIQRERSLSPRSTIKKKRDVCRTVGPTEKKIEIERSLSPKSAMRMKKDLLRTVNATENRIKSVKRKNKNETLPYSKKSHYSENTSKTSDPSSKQSADSSKNKLFSSNKSMESESFEMKKGKRRHTRATKKNYLYAMSDLPKEESSTEENDLPETD